MTLSFSRTQQLMQLSLLMVHSWCVCGRERASEREEGREDRSDCVFSYNSLGMRSLSRVYSFQRFELSLLKRFVQ